jgi:hypothetical protein
MIGILSLHSFPLSPEPVEFEYNPAEHDVHTDAPVPAHAKVLWPREYIHFAKPIPNYVSAFYIIAHFICTSQAVVFVYSEEMWP